MSAVIVVSESSLASRVRRVTPLEVVSVKPSASIDTVAEVAAAQTAGSLVVVGPDVDLSKAFDLVDLIHRLPTPTPVLLARERPESVGPIHGESGVLEVVDTDAQEEELREVIGRLAPSQRRSVQSGEQGDRRIVVVLSPKGGVGKTTITANLAVEMSIRTPLNAVVVDFDSQFGDVASAYDLSPSHTIEEAFTEGGIQGSLVVQGLLNIYQDRLFVLGASASPAALESVSTGQLKNLLLQLADDYGSIIVDTAAGITDATIAALEVATDVILVSTMDVSTIRSLHRAVELLDRLQLMPIRRYLVVNMTDEEVGLNLSDVAESLHLEVKASIPRSPEVAFSMNVGEPIVQRRAGSDMQSAIRDLVDAIVGDNDSRPTRNRSSRLWKRGRE